MRLKEITDYIESRYSLELAYEWDNVGLVVGNEDSQIKRVMTCLDADRAAIQKALSSNVDLIISHHPLIFKGITKINSSTSKGQELLELIRNGINVYCMHTNYDIAREGLNDHICELLQLRATRLLGVTAEQQLYKIAVYVPKGHEDAVREALASSGAGHTGNYDSCTFGSSGIGTFRPLEGSKPFIGALNTIEKVEEVKIETICPHENIKAVLERVIQAHPYEEPAYDVYELANRGQSQGIGRVGTLEKRMMLSELVQEVKARLELDSVKVCGDLDMLVDNVAVVSGSGAEFVADVVKAGAQVLITGDVKYHQAQEALERGIAIIDAGHYGTEKHFSKMMKDFLEARYGEISIEAFEGKDVFECV